jgi:GxxExxY protein
VSAEGPIPDAAERSTHVKVDPLHEAMGQAIVDCGFKVHRVLGPGLLESAYETCLAYELTQRGFAVRRQVAQPIVYEDLTLEAGYRIDLLVNDAVIVEVKAIDTLLPIHQAQIMTYLRLSGCRLGFLINFNVKMFRNGIRRIVF